MLMVCPQISWKNQFSEDHLLKNIKKSVIKKKITYNCITQVVQGWKNRLFKDLFLKKLRKYLF